MPLTPGGGGSGDRDVMEAAPVTPDHWSAVKQHP
ncbi:unnamed protein product [Tetraodon nigroviridis]|uniref:(spotted green pufferfish) hypothetical protein n=1 Tax=Tetraodon nigroviridis TaxID=99883 RepID=Q4T9V6_TETNG|nr:unnamed protein product [Tetraodon nigroviridis]